MNPFLFMLITCLFLSHSTTLQAQENDSIGKTYLVVTQAYPLPGDGQKQFPNIDFKLGLNKKPPFKLGIQFENHGYDSTKIRFAIKDLTTKKMLLLDPVHNSNAISTTLSAIANTPIWSAVVDNNKDLFSLHIWDEKDQESATNPISVKEQ